MKTLTLILSLIISTSLSVRGQQKKSVVIGSMISRPNAVLVINPPNGDQGFLLPQLTSAQRLSIKTTSPTDDGLLLYDLTEKSFYYWNNDSWIKGLGNQASPTLSYDPTTQKLSISGGNVIDLVTLKEIPSTTGNKGNFLTNDGTTLSWATVGSLGDITGVVTNGGSALSGGDTTGDVTLAVNTDATTISVNGSNQLQLSNGAVTSAKVSANAINATHILDGSITGSDILDNSIAAVDISNGAVTSSKLGTGQVNTTHIASGGNTKVLTTSSTGVVGWEDQSSLSSDDQGLSLTANTLNIDNGIAANLNALTLNGDVTGNLNSNVVRPNAINSGHILDGSISSADLSSPGADQVLVSNGIGAVTWVNRTIFDDDNQNLNFSGNTLTIQNGNAVNISAAGQVTGLIDNLAINPGTANQSLVTNGAGTGVQWVTSAGDVIGTVSASTVARIQGRNVANVIPALGQALIWNGTEWTPATIAPSPVTQYLAVDPSGFVALEPGGNTGSILGLFEDGNNRFVFAKGPARQILAAVNLPHGATIQNLTIYYEYTLLLGGITIELMRKQLTGGANEVISSVTTPLLSLGMQTTSTTASGVVDNSVYSYRLHVTFSNLLNVNDPNLAIQRIHGVRIQYSK